MANVLVTGAAGFIGSHLCEALLNQGHKVLGVDSFSDYYDPKVKHANLAAVKNHLKAAQFRFLQGDLLQMELAEIFKDQQIVFHLAGEPGVRKSWGKDFSFYLDRNIALTQRLLEACKGAGIARFVFASSSSVYGNRGQSTLHENDACRPFSPYGVSKLAAENLCMLYHDNFGVPAVALRYFTVFGPRQRPDMGFHKFIRNVLADQSIEIFGDGEQSRDFTFVSDAVAGTIAAGFAPTTSGKVYNIGGGCMATVNEVLSLLGKIMPEKKINILHREESHGDVRHTRADILAARQDFGFSPMVSLQEGLTREISWLKENA